MQLTSHNIRHWARKWGATSEDFRCLVEMETVTCRVCGDRFTDVRDLDDDRLCELCADDEDVNWTANRDLLEG